MPGTLGMQGHAWSATLGASWPTLIAALLVASGLLLLVVIGVRHALRRRRPSGLQELLRRAASELDAKAERLERLITEADARIARLESAEPVVVEATSETREPGSVMGPSPAGSSAELLTRRVCELSAGGLSPREIARRLNEHQGKIELILALKRS